MRGIAINAARIDAFKPNVAIIQLRLRVWMVPIDSNVASSNMAASLKSRIQPRRLGGAEDVPQSASGHPARKRLTRGAGIHGLPIIPFGTTVIV